MKFHTRSETYWQFYFCWEKERQLSLRVVALLSQSCPSGRTHIQEYLCSTNCIKNWIQNWMNEEGDLGRDVGGADTIKTHYARLSNTIFKYKFYFQIFLKLLKFDGI